VLVSGGGDKGSGASEGMLAMLLRDVVASSAKPAAPPPQG